MDRSQLLSAIEACAPVPGDVVYLERNGSEYDWRLIDPGSPLPHPGNGAAMPDAWLFYSGAWPDDAARFAAHLDDLLAEMDSMTGGVDRCRWPLDEPYPLPH